MNFTALENALLAWLTSSTGLAAGSVYLAHQDGLALPPGQCIVLSVGDVMAVGQDEVTQVYNSGAPAGQEIVTTARGVRTLEATVSFYGPETVGDATARTMAIAAMSGLGLWAIRDALNEAGLGVSRVGTVKWLPRIEGVEWKGRAVLDVTFAVRSEATATTTYIERVSGTGEVTPA